MLDAAAIAWLQRRFASTVRFDEPMARHTSFKIGGPADALVAPEKEEQLERLIQWTRKADIPYMAIGGGTNLLVKDGGIRGLVIQLDRLAATANWRQDGKKIFLTAGAGMPTKRVCTLALKQGWRGMNFALGIPGSLGGAVWMNAGTALGCMADRLASITLISGEGEKVQLPRNQIGSQYRQLQLPASLLGDPGRPAILLAAELELTVGHRDDIRREAMQLMQARARRLPSWQPSVGCFFKNPSPEQPAGALIDAAGLKGHRVGDAKISSRHANFILNCGNATAEDVLGLMTRIRDAVRSRFNIDLNPEVRIVGEEKDNAQKPL